MKEEKTPKEAILEALFWIEAEEHGFTDGLGGCEWLGRVERGEVSPEALAILKVAVPWLDEVEEEESQEP